MKEHFQIHEGSRSGPATAALEQLCAPAHSACPPPRVLFVVAHPDDEIVGAAGRLLCLEIAAVLYATDGAPRDGQDARTAGCTHWREYAQLRRDEALRALAMAGISPARAAFLGYPDQHASFNLSALTADVDRWITATEPDIVLTHPYEGGHPDHDAVAFSVHAAVAASVDNTATPPLIAEFTSYHARDGAWQYGEFLPSPPCGEHTIVLSEQDQRFKRSLLACHRSQASTLQSVPLTHERFRLAPTYNFAQPPHSGPLLYERFSWGMNAQHWCELAHRSLKQLATTSSRSFQPWP